MTSQKHIAIVYPAGIIRTSPEQRQARIEELNKLGFLVTELLPKIESPDRCTSSPVLERATLLSYALTMRKFTHVWADRGGVGTTELVPYLEHLLPPVIPEKTVIGFSDISFLGVYLSSRFPNLTYIHGQNFFANNLFSGFKLDETVLFDTLEFKQREFTFPAREVPSNYTKKPREKISGSCLPLNLSLAESMAACPFVTLPKNNIIFLEECNEYLYRILRKIDSLINSGFLAHTKALVLGSFNGCLHQDETPVERSVILKLFADKTRLPIFDLPIFGHEEFRFPLIAKSTVDIQNKKITLRNYFEKPPEISTNFSPELFRTNMEEISSTRIHMTGIGGTGMAQVAGFFVKAGFPVTGSDNPIYPPMDKIISALDIKPDVGFLAENIEKNTPDRIILANVVSRLSASLTKNEELEALLNQRVPVMSFPSALRKYFLHNSRNVVISGTHGKTTTSSLVAYLFDQLKLNPSFLIGGSPVNFQAGFSLRSKDLFVLEGDEYDSAFFDKGPKFLHYEPQICLINNIEFDHADIYENVEAIENEFLRLAKLTQDRKGILIANYDEKRVRKIADFIHNNGGKVIGFTKEKECKSEYPLWKLKTQNTNARGLTIEAQAPNGRQIQFEVGIFGEHNAMNMLASLAILQAYYQLDNVTDSLVFLETILPTLPSFKGVKRRFELLAERNNISVFDDFAHHPTAISTTVQAFLDYKKSSQKNGKLVVCFDPRNATMRRNVLQKELIQSFSKVDMLLLGKVPQDLRMNSNDVLNGTEVAKACGPKARYFHDNQELLQNLKQQVAPGDTVVFMSSGSFDGLPHQFAKYIQEAQ